MNMSMHRIKKNIVVVSIVYILTLFHTSIECGRSCLTRDAWVLENTVKGHVLGVYVRSWLANLICDVTSRGTTSVRQTVPRATSCDVVFYEIKRGQSSVICRSWVVCDAADLRHQKYIYLIIWLIPVILFCWELFALSRQYVLPSGRI